MYLDQFNDTFPETQEGLAEQGLLGIIYDGEQEIEELRYNLSRCKLKVPVRCLPCMDKGPLTLEFFLGLFPDFLIIDLDATGEDGMEFGRLIRKYLDYEIPIIYTAASWEAYENHIKDTSGKTFFLIKPYPFKKLEEIFSNYLV